MSALCVGVADTLQTKATFLAEAYIIDCFCII